MTLTRLAFRSFRHYRRTHAAVAFGVAAAVAVVAGALLVGSSVRSSLEAITAGRLGRTDVVVASETLFTDQLGERISAALATEGGAHAALLTLSGLTRHESSGRRAGPVSVYGVDDRFFAFHHVTVDAPTGSTVMLSPDLASELGASEGDTVIVRVTRPTDVPLDSLHGQKDDTGRTMRLELGGLLPRELMGEFSLAPEQGPVRAAFVPLARLQRDLNLPAGGGTVNTLLFAGGADGPADPNQIRRALRASLTSEDVGLTFSVVDRTFTIIAESSSGLISDALQESVTTLATRESLTTTAVLTWLANRMTVGEQTAPYSLVTAVGPDGGGDTGLADLLDWTGQEPPPIVLNEWAADDLLAATGDALELEYYRWTESGRLAVEQTTFRVAGVIPIRGVAADQRLAPDYPGISGADNLGDWDPPFPIDLSIVRPIDEDYWNRYRTIPKAFIPLAAGQRLWQTRYGQVSSLRIRPAFGTTSLPATAEMLRTSLPQAIDPLRGGIGIADVRTQNLAASVGATDFGAYFFYFSFFLVVSAVLLAALFFRLSVEQRLTEIGLLRAEGFSLAQVRRLFLVEGALVSVAGALAGIVLAVVWAGLMMYGLRTWWVGAVGTTELTLHIDPIALVAGAVGGAVAGLASIAMTVRGLSRLTPRTLLTGTTQGTSTSGAPRATQIAIGSFALAVALSGASVAGAIPAVGGFFGAGALALIGGLAAFRRWLARRRPGALTGQGTRGLVRLGVQNASWRPGRSLTAAALVAAAVFLLVSVDSFRKGGETQAGYNSGIGGFALIAEAALPLVHDPATIDGREALGLEFQPGDPEFAGVSFVVARLRQGEDASCLNLYQPKQPRVLGVPASFVAANRFRFAATMDTGRDLDNPWQLLGPPDATGVVPAIMDANSLQYIFHAAVGDEIVIDVETSRPVTLRIVASLRDTMLQSEILIADTAFVALYPDVPGHRVMLVEVPDDTPERIDAVVTLIEERLEPYGVDAQESARRLESYHRVENTYLSTFQTLGGLGLVLGSLGLAAVIARNVLERRRELALLGAAGYTGRQLQTVVLAEHLLLVAAGLLTGVAAALVAIAPVMLARGGGPPGLPLAWIAGVAATGLVASLAATRRVRRLPLVPALRSE